MSGEDLLHKSGNAQKWGVALYKLRDNAHSIEIALDGIENEKLCLDSRKR